MTNNNANPVVMRRSFLARLSAMLGGAGVGFASGASSVGAQTNAGAFQPSRHSQDDWMDGLRGRHRMVVDTTSAEGFGAGLLYARNFVAASRDGYGLP